MSVIMDIRRKIVKACVSNGITDTDEITLATIKAVRGISDMTLSAYKAWDTIRAQRRRRKNRMARR